MVLVIISRTTVVNQGCSRGQNSTHVHPGHRSLGILFLFIFNAHDFLEDRAVYKNVSEVTTG